uniref:Ribonuclease P protein subunit p29 n=1 Tax=Parascaris univalens TaxID=6257 RepID=A0A915AY63_PARUN
MNEAKSNVEFTNPYKTFVLEKRIRRERRIHTRPISNFVRRRVRTEDLKNLKYTQFVALYEMWCEYFRGLLNATTKRADERILKADFHGCLLMVTDASNPSQIGLHGIVARETRHTLQLITKMDRLLTVPKQGSTFCFAFEGKVYTLFGDAFRYPPPSRVKKMMKCRSIIPFFLK